MIVPYAPVSLDTSLATITTHAAETNTGVVSGVGAIASTDWAWAKCSATNPFPGTPDPYHICLKNGFDPTLAYQVVFTAKDPAVVGIGYAAFRDVASFFKNETQDDLGTANPVAGSIKWVIARGESQSASFLRGFLNLGFNQDEAGRQVYEGAWPFASGTAKSVNLRWGIPGGGGELDETSTEGTSWWEDHADPIRGLPANGMLDRCRSTNTCPKIMEHYGSADLWDLRVGQSWYGRDLVADIPLPDNVRRYYLSSTTHLGGVGSPNTGINASLLINGPTIPVCEGNNWGVGILSPNPVPHWPTINALRVHLRDWVMKGTLPPRRPPG
jgi:hypothetical protein